MILARVRTRGSASLWAFALTRVLSVGVTRPASAQSAIEQLEEMTGSTLDFGSATSGPPPQYHPPMPGFCPIQGQSSNDAQR